MSDSAVPSSDSPRPHRPVEAFATLRAAVGLEDGAALPPQPRSEGPEFMPHAQWEEQRPDELESALAYEQGAAHRFAATHGGSIEGWVPRREFPCPGVLRIEDQTGVLWPVVCDVCGYETGVQVQKIDPGRLLEQRLAKAAVPPMFAGKTFENAPAQEMVLKACREWVKGFRREPLPAVALWGGPGRGKSHLLSLMVETLVRQYDADAMYRSASELFDQLRAGFDTGSYESQWQRVLSVKVLALDDLAASRMTEWQADRFAALVDHRYSKELPLLVATNLPPAAWAEVFGARTASRLRGMALPFHLEGRDWRAQGVQTRMDEAA